MSASYHRHKEPEKGCHLLLLGLCGGTELVYSPDMAVHGQRLHRDPTEWQIKCGAHSRENWFIGLLRPEKGRSLFHSHVPSYPNSSCC